MLIQFNYIMFRIKFLIKKNASSLKDQFRQHLGKMLFIYLYKHFEVN